MAVTYKNIHVGKFKARPNRFIAKVEIDGEIITCHVKNTGRCRELLTQDAIVYLEKSDNSNRKTAYDLISSGQEEKGLLEIRDFLSNNPKVWNAWFMLGWGFRRLEKFAEAKQAYEEALKCEGGDKNSDVYNELSLCYVEEKNFTEAKKCLLKAYELAPESTKVISNLGYLALAQGNKQEARNYFTTVLEFDPKDKIAANELLKLEQED